MSTYFIQNWIMGICKSKNLSRNFRGIFIKTLIFFFITLYLISFLSLSVYAKDYKETDFTKNNPQIVADWEKLIKESMDKSSIKGLSAAVVDENGILWTEGFGYTDKSNKTKVNPDTIFSVQSISKTITSTAVMKAVQDGILDLDKPICYYLPDFKVNSAFETNPERKITLRHLLSHTAGFTHETTVGSNFDSFSPSFEEHIKSISNTWLKFPVGENYSYSNLGVDLAGYILEKVSGKPFYQYVDENIAKPLGMTNSSFDMKYIKSNKNRAVGQGNIYWKVPLEIPIIPSGGFYSSSLDMAKFIQFHINNGRVQNQSIIEGTYLNEMYKLPFPVQGQTEGYALGVGKGKAYTTYLLNHNGGGFGFLSSMTWYPELKIGVIVLSNTYTVSSEAPEPGYISAKILERIIQDPKTTYNSRLMSIKTDSLAKSSVSYGDLQNNLVKNVSNRLSAIKPTGMVTDYKKYTGIYTYSMDGIPFVTGNINVNIKDNHLYANNDVLTEVKEGIFYLNTGEVLDLSSNIPRFSNIKIKKLAFGLKGCIILIGACILSFLSLPFAGLSKRDKGKNSYKFRDKGLYKLILALNILLFIFYIIFILYFATLASKGLTAVNQASYIKIAMFISFIEPVSLLVIILLPIILLLNILVWKSSFWTKAGKIHYSVITIFCIIFTILLRNFNLILI